MVASGFSGDVASGQVGELVIYSSALGTCWPCRSLDSLDESLGDALIIYCTKIPHFGELSVEFQLKNC